MLAAATLEIQAFLPPALLQGVDIGALDLDAFSQYLGMAEYCEEMWVRIMNRAIAATFGENDN